MKSKTPEATGRVQLQHLHHLQRVTTELHKHPQLTRVTARHLFSSAAADDHLYKLNTEKRPDDFGLTPCLPSGLKRA